MVDCSECSSCVSPGGYALRFGVHMPLKGGFAVNLKRIAGIGCQTIQMFPGNPTGWRMGKLEQAEIDDRVKMLDQYNIKPLVIHCAYLINLATSNQEFLSKSKRLLNETMERADLHQAPYVVLHTGNHGGQGVKEGIAQVIDAISEAFPKWPKSVKLLLENTAGSGTAIGSNFKELAAILDTLPRDKFGVCIDTAHAWAAGYDISNPKKVDAVLAELDQFVGLDSVKAIHVNDTMVECGARVDRHAHIGEGKITSVGFEALLNRNWPEDLPVILETPENGTEWDRINLDILRVLTG